MIRTNKKYLSVKRLFHWRGTTKNDVCCITFEIRWSIDFETVEISLLVNSLHASTRGCVEMEHKGKYLTKESRKAKFRSSLDSHARSGTKMQASSMNLLAAGLSLFCFVHPLHGDPQGFYSTNYESYNPAFHISDPVHRVAQFPERYDPPSTRKSSLRVAQYRETSEATPEEDQFEKPLLLLSYSRGMTETVQPAVYNRYSDFGSGDREEKAKEDRTNVEDEDKKSDLDEEAIIEKMRILDRLLSEDSGEKDFDTNVIGDKIISEESKRVVREVKKKKPGLFWSLAKIMFEAISDTTSAIKEIATIINNSIAPDSATASSMMKGSLKDADSSNMTNVNGTETTTSIPTTTPFVLTRQTLQSLIRRNVLGLVKLFNIEWKDALNQSETNVKEFQRDLGNQIGSFFRDRRDT